MRWEFKLCYCYNGERDGKLPMKTISVQAIVLIWLLSIGTLFAKPIDITKNNISILEQSDVYLDDHNYTLQQIIHEKKLVPYHKQVIRTGTQKKRAWIRFTFKNDTDKTYSRIILFGEPPLENIYFYDESNLSKPDIKGLSHTNKDHVTLQHYFPITLAPHTTKQFYAMVYSEYSYLNFNVTLEEEDAYIQRDRVTQIVDMFLIGFIFSLMVYSFVLSIYIKDKSYFFYALYLIPLLVYQFKFVGLMQIYFPKELIELDLKGTVIRFYVLMITNALYAMYFLDIRRHTKLHRVFIAFIITTVILMVFFTTPYILVSRLTSLLGLFLMIFNLAVGIYVYKQGYIQARLYIIGFLIVFFTCICLITDYRGFTSVLLDYPNILLWATAFEALVLSLAFADRYVILQEEKEENYRLFFEESRNREMKVAAEVEEKTKQLSTEVDNKALLLQEVHHRVKNNLQLILSMLRLQQMDIPDQQCRSFLNEFGSRINAIATSYDLLIVDDDLQRIDMALYMNALVESIHKNFANDIDIQIDIDITLALNEAIYVGLIANEILTNAYKYAFNGGKGTLRILFKKEDDICTLIIEDDGKGFDWDKQKSSLGLKLIDILVNNQLQGNMKVDTQGKTRYEIMFYPCTK